MRDLPEAMIETAARVLYNMRREPGRDHWTNVHNDDITKRAYRYEAKAVLTAALTGYDILPVIGEPQESQGGR